MKARITLFAIAGLMSVFLFACPLAPPGAGTSKAVLDDGAVAVSSGTTGQISVVNDEARGQAVYINESGTRFDVAAEEYPGGPLVRCVQVADFTLVPQTTDSAALPVKAVVAGTRDDGTPGVWNINSDDTFVLPQPEQTDDNAARCIVGNDMPSLPDGIQMRFGWSFTITAVSADGKMIVGIAENKVGTTIGGVRIPAHSTIGVYWRVSSLPYTRICVVSAPRVIGTVTKQPLPTGWDRRPHSYTDILTQLKLFLAGKLGSYLTTATAVRLHSTGVMATAAKTPAAYDVTGFDEEGLPSLATIDPTNAVTIIVTVPDLAVISVQAVPAPEFIDSPWTPSAVVSNIGNASADPVTIQYWLSSSNVLDQNSARSIGTATIPTIAAGASVTDNSLGQQTIKALGFGPGTFYLFAVATADPSNFEVNLDNNSGLAQLVVSEQTTTSPPSLGISAAAALDPIRTGVTWTVPVTVTNATGAGGASGYSLGVSITNDADLNDTTAFSTASFTLAGGTTTTVAVTGSFAKPGTHHILITVNAPAVVTAAVVRPPVTTVSVVAPVIYDRIDFDTFNPFDPNVPFASFNTTIDVFGPNGDTSTVGGLSGYDVFKSPDTAITPSPLASDTGNSPLRPAADINTTGSGYAYAEYAPQAGILPGATFYVRVHFANQGDASGYAIRVIPGWTAYTAQDHAVSIPTTQTETDAPTLGGEGVPTAFSALGVSTSMGRFLDAGSVSWFKVVLP